MKSIIIIGGGTAGLSAAAQIQKKIKNVSVTLFEPSEHHYYQPLYTLVGAGADKKEKTKRLTKDYIAPGVNWIKKKIASFEPESNQITDESGEQHNYDFLIVAPGIQIDWHLIEGLKDTLGKNGVCSIYGYQEAEDTFNTIKAFKGGDAVFTAGSTPVKCGGASQKIMYLSEAYFRKTGIREKTNVIFASAGTTIFGVPGYKEALQKVVDSRNIKTQFFHDLIKVDGPNKKAYFSVRKVENGEVVNKEEKEMSFDMLHVVPPQSAPDFIKNSPLAIQEETRRGWLDVDQFSLQHNRYPNVFGLGDACGLPTAKTGAAVRKQLPVVVGNIKNLLEGKELDKELKYNGYSACPILTDYKHVVMAEFNYGNVPNSSFFFNTKKPLWIMYLLKHYFLPWFYWKRMLKGRDNVL
jgi:sulfide:quinone oxidoreductase